MSERFDDEAAAGYEAWYRTAQGRRADRLEKAALSQMLEAFPEARTVLEVGCGTAHFSRWLNAEGWMAAGLDISRPMLKHARLLGGDRLVRGNAFGLPFADGSFDLCMMVTTLEFLEHPGAAVAQALRVAHRGLVLGVLNCCSFLGIHRRLRGLFRETVYDDARFYSVRGLKRVIREAAPEARVVRWATTLNPRYWPLGQQSGRWGGFIAAAVGVAEE